MSSQPVPGELHAEAVGGFRGMAVADVIGEDEEILCDVEGGRPGPKSTSEKTGSRRERALLLVPWEEEDRVLGFAVGSAVGFAEGDVVGGGTPRWSAVPEVESWVCCRSLSWGGLFAGSGAGRRRRKWSRLRRSMRRMRRATMMKVAPWRWRGSRLRLWKHGRRVYLLSCMVSTAG